MKKIGKVTSVLLVLLTVFLAGCTGKTQSKAVDKITSGGLVTKLPKDKSIYVEAKERKDLKKVRRSDMAVLFFDEETMSVSLYDFAGKKLWNSLPEKYTTEAPCVMSVEVLAGTKVYTFNSQTDSVLKNAAAYEISGDSITVNYTFKGEIEGKEIKFSVPVYYVVTDGVMTVSVDCSKIDKSALSSDMYIKKIHLLEYFGSSTEGKKGDFIFIPDGCGAVIDTEKKAADFKKINLDVYGSDFSSGEKEKKAYARVAAYGMKSGESAFAAIIENGDAIAEISAAKALHKGSYNRVGPAFDLIKTYTKDGKTYISEKGYEGEIRITYKLVSSDRANYVAMASAVREALIRNGTLGMQDIENESSSLPFVLSVVLSADDEEGKNKVLTSYAEAEDIITLFRSKGISNMVLRLRGAFDGGIQQKEITSFELNRKSGSAKDFSKLIEFTDLQNISVFADVNTVSAENVRKKDRVVSIIGEKTEASITDLENSVIKSKGKRGFVSASGISEAINSLVSSVRELEIDGVCVSDASRYLYGDYSKKSFSTRQEMKNNIFSSLSAIPSSARMMIDEANIYAVKYADYAVDLPTAASVHGREYCSSVPFLHALLRGVVTYSSTPINLSSNYDNALLKAAEYGAVPSFAVYHADLSEEKKTDNSYYMNCAGTAQSVYERLSNTFSSLVNEKITNHYRVKKGVYCTEYSGSISVYVNYNDTDVRVNGVTVEARSFLRVG